MKNILNLSKHLKDEFPKTDTIEALHICVGYLLQTINSTEFQASFRKIVQKSEKPKIKKFRLLIKRSGYVVLNYRAFVYHVMDLPLNLTSKARNERVLKLAKDFDIRLRDAHNTQNPLIYDDIDFIHQVQDLNTKQFDSVVQVHKIKRSLNEMIQPLTKHSQRYALKKLRFIAKSCNLDIRDLTSEMLIKAIEAFYWTFPNEKSDAHTLNFLRRTCSNHGINMIQYYTARRRSRLVERGGEFELMVVSENQFKDMETNYESLSSTEKVDLELNMSVNELFHVYKNKPKTILFLRMLMGHRHEPFSKWLRQRGYIHRRGDNSSFLTETDPKMYIELVSEYLGIHQPRVDNFMKHLQFSLA